MRNAAAPRSDTASQRCLVVVSTGSGGNALTVLHGYFGREVPAAHDCAEGAETVPEDRTEGDHRYALPVSEDRSARQFYGGERNKNSGEERVGNEALAALLNAHVHLPSQSS